MGATPTLEGLCDYAAANDLKQLTLRHLHLGGPTKWTQPNFKGLADFNSVFLHEVPLLFRSGAVKLNAISPPDDSGYCTLGRNVDATRAAITHADHITGIGAIPDATLASLANHKIGNAFRWSTKTLIAMQSQI
ncbi:unnamed protein product [Wuchereria bancrofti]|uniref:Uncharacterized protein n=1 Tax=Wuchereria bancrofti TaxID=6293 RepID=A0A3P7DIU0_WUCBA|nr:unnamed protein product [Wuchereria bancrofti]